MSNPRLYKDMIHNPRLWQLHIAIDRAGLEIMAYTPLEEHSLITARIPFEPGASTAAGAVEDAIYDNPLLLSDFKHVTILVRDTPHAILPAAVADDRDMLTAITDELAGAAPDEPLVDTLPLLDAAVSYRLDPAVLNFLRRTFTNATFTHRISALTRYWHGTNRATGSLTTHVNLRHEGADIVTFAGNRLLVANSYRTPTPADTLYYIMAVREMVGARPDTPVVIAGDRQAREALLPMLSGCVQRAVPAVFPVAMFRAGGQTAMNTPLDLIVLPLCE